MIIATPERVKRCSHRSNEGKIQSECFQWFHNAFPQYRGLLFHVPNENERSDSNIIQGAIRKSLGVVAGVSDFLFLVARGQYHGLCIEMKDKKGLQKEKQKEWQKIVEAQNYRYEICRSLEQFQSIFHDYLSLSEKK